MIETKLNTLARRIARLEKLSQEQDFIDRLSEEDMFFDNPLTKNVREFAESKAISNDIDIAENAKDEMLSTKSEREMKSEAIVAPPTPTEIRNKPGGEEFSTLTQFVIDTDEEVETPKVNKAEPPPKSLEEGEKLDLAEKAQDRDVSRAEKIRAIKTVMNKKSSYRSRR